MKNTFFYIFESTRNKVLSKQRGILMKSHFDFIFQWLIRLKKLEHSIDIIIEIERISRSIYPSYLFTCFDGTMNNLHVIIYLRSLDNWVPLLAYFNRVMAEIEY